MMEELVWNDPRVLRADWSAPNASGVVEITWDARTGGWRGMIYITSAGAEGAVTLIPVYWEDASVGPNNYHESRAHLQNSLERRVGLLREALGE